MDVGQRFGVLIVWIFVIVVFSVLRPSSFFTTGNVQTILGSQAVPLILTLGLLPSLTAGEFDLSVTGVMSVSLVLVGWLNVLQHWPIVPTVLVALGAGVLMGLINALLIVGVGVESIIVTLGTGALFGGVAEAINGVTTSGISQGLVDVARDQILGLPLAFFYALALTVAVWYIFAFTPIGRYLYFVGAGRNVARLSGLPVDRIRVLALVSTSITSAFAGVIFAGTLGAADPNISTPLLLPAFAGAFLGSTVITPGRFNPWGSFIAVYFLVTGITGLELLGLSGWIEDAFYGASLVVAVTLSRLISRRRSPRREVGDRHGAAHPEGTGTAPAHEQIVSTTQ
ncbi:MAG TPA: ABC transporter permease [Acidimicrobiales bacterium]|nr:ABC transporter permease [Acidimicrobiales bacterium]